MSKLHDEFVADIGRSESIDDNVHSLLESIADRIDACKGNKVKLSDLSTILREDHQAVASAVQKVVVVPVVDEPAVQVSDEPRRGGPQENKPPERVEPYHDEYIA